MDREIAYNRNEASAVGVCPCCGDDASHNAYACQKCYMDYIWTMRGFSVGPRVPLRDAFYELGVKLRAEGKMPALAEQKYGVWCLDLNRWLLTHAAGPAWSGSRTEAEKSVADSIMRDQREVRPYPGPAAPALCPECKAAPCDCEKEIWTYWFRYKGDRARTRHGEDHSGGNNHHWTKRPELVERQAKFKELWPSYDYGPIQRVTDPPYMFEDGGNKTPGPAPLKATSGARSFTKDTFARAIFDTDKRVRAFVSAKAENDVARMGKVMAVAWTRNEGGWRTEAEKIAARVFEGGS